MFTQYEKIRQQDDESRDCSRPPPSITSRVVWITTFIAFILGSGFGYMLAGSKVFSLVPPFLEPPGDHRVTLHYNRTFVSPPSPPVEAAWASLFPVGRGFVQHPQLSPEISGLAVFHELHCLDALRLSIQTSREGASTKPGESNSSQHSGSHSHHVRHCIDYLRQSLMCHADTTLEPVDWNLGGVTGWGVERRCRDYGKVVEWANEHPTHNQSTIS